MPLIRAILTDESLLKNAANYLSDTVHFHIWWLGQSGYLLQWNGKRVLIDPYLSDSLTKKYADTQKPHIRMSERVIDPELFRDISVVTSSHNHTDHLDAETLIPLLKNNPGIKFIIPEANRSFVANRVNCDIDFPIGLNDNKQVTTDGFTFHGIPAKHNELERDEHGNCKYMGYVIQFDRWSIYHSGDTLWFDGMEEILKPFKIDLALLPINGDRPERGVAGNLSTKEAPALAKAIGTRMVIPCHYDMFTFNTASSMEFAKEAASIQQPYTVLHHGGHWGSDLLR